MTDAKQTKCPHCGSTFRISDAQLAAKGGSVRCGSCLQVFRADLHLVGAASAPAAPAPTAAAAPKPKKKGASEDWAMDLLKKEGAPAAAEDWKLPEDGGASDEFGFSDDDISDFMTKGPAVEPAPQGKSLLFDDELSDQLDGIEPPGLPGEEDTHRLNENADESWAQDILSELQTEEQKEAQKKYSMEIVDDKSKGKPRNPKLAAAVGMAPPESATPPSRSTPARSAPPADDFLGDDADVLSFLDDDDLSQGPTSVPPPVTANPFSLDRPLAHVDAPVVLKQQREPIRWGYLLGWTFLCLVAVALLVTQYIYFNFDKLAVDPRVRPVFEQVCARAGCYLPDIPDPTKLRVEELVVRKHPEIEGALVVDAILKNNASFPQPFPILKLRFSNSADEVIASRQLKPLQYLQGEARLLRRIPPETPVHVSLEIVDPGQEAVSYALEPRM